MMRPFTKVSPALWKSSRFNGLPSDDARYLLLYLLTGPHQSSIGCYHLPEGYACVDLQWEIPKYRSTLAELLRSGLIVCDTKTNEIFIAGWFQHNEPTNPKHIMGMERNIKNIKSDTIRDTVRNELEQAANAFGYKLQSGEIGAREVVQRCNNRLNKVPPLRSTDGR